MTISISPSGLLHLHPSEALSEVLSDPREARLMAAFDRGAGAGLLHLGASESNTELPLELAFFRDFGRLFVSRLCTLSEVDTIPPPSPQELVRIIESRPPIPGGEYISVAMLQRLWSSLEDAFQQDFSSFEGELEAYLHEKNPIWNRVGRVCFHLAENKRHPDKPFAFMATYTERLSESGKPRHLPLAAALKRYAAANQKDLLLSLLKPVQRAAEVSPLVQELVQSQKVYRPQAWTPQQAHAFLSEVPTLESCGLTTRIPDWWQTQSPSRRLRVNVTLDSTTSSVDLNTLLSFDVHLALGGERLAPAEVKELLAASEQLVLIKGRWVEVDRDSLNQVLEHWKLAQKATRQGLTFIEGMRLLAGAPVDAVSSHVDEDTLERWSELHTSERLSELLSGLREPERLNALSTGDELRATLRPYQEVGVRWLWLLNQLGLGGCLADDMGLGKTLQVLALMLLKQQHRESEAKACHLLVVPTSLIVNWVSEARRFTPSLRFRVAHRSARGDLALEGEDVSDDVDVVITTYGMLRRLKWLRSCDWDLVVLDEAQAIKTPSTQQARAAHALSARTRIALTGTPIENNLSELWSIFRFTCPGLLGTSKQFQGFVKRLEDPNGHVDYSPLRRLISPYLLRRLKSDPRVITDLPDKTELRTYCSLTPQQGALYQQTLEELEEQLRSGVEAIRRRGLILASLTRLKQICNHPSQWLGQESFPPKASGKFQRLAEICEEIHARQEKVLVFTQFKQLIAPLERFMRGVFGHRGLVLHGATSVEKRAERVATFQREDGPGFFILSLKAGGTGLNLTAASHVVHFDRWWNPAVENQATDRAYRIGQRRNVLVHKFVCQGTIEEHIDRLITEKQQLAEELLSDQSQAALTEMSNDELLSVLALDVERALAEV